MARISIRQLVGKLFQNFNISHIGQCNKTFIVNWQDDANASNRQANSLPAAPTCDPLYKYRSFDGTCNNLNNPRFGQAGTNFQRLMGPANYADGTESDFSLLWKHKRFSVILVTICIHTHRCFGDSFVSIGGRFAKYSLGFDHRHSEQQYFQLRRFINYNAVGPVHGPRLDTNTAIPDQ